MWTFKGTVTDINEDLLYFKLNGNINIHMVLLFIDGMLTKLPKLNSEVEIEMSHQHFSSTSTYFQSIILCSDCRIVGNFISEASVQSQDYIKLIELHNFNFEDLLIIDNNLKIIEENFKSHQFTTAELIIGIVSIVSRRKRSKFLLKTVNQLKYLENNRELYKKFSYWTFGVHKLKEPLIAYLEHDLNCGRLFLSDFNIKIPVIFTNTGNIDCINNIIIIWNCRVITELFNCEKFSAIQYCLVDYNDIELISIKIDNKKILENSHKFHNSFHFVVVSKSLPMIVEDQTLKLWLLVRVINKKSTNSETILLYLDSCYVGDFLNLQIGNTYTICYKRNLRKINIQNIYALYPNHPQYYLEKDNGIINERNNEIDQSLVTINTEDEAIPQITSKNLVSFQGRIVMKKFTEPLWSSTTACKSDDNFGTPGTKTHLIEFHCDDNQRLTVYLNNFENLSRPYGLIPNMMIIVRNVIGHNGKYFKSTRFTSFEIINYQPDIDFITANLTNSSDWGQMCYLGLKLPIGVIISATIFNMFLLGLSLKNQCIDCNAIVRNSEFCQICRSSALNVSSSVTLLTRDYFGTSKIIGKDCVALDLIKLLLGNYREICDFIKITGEYKYQCKKSLRSIDNIVDRLCDNYNMKKNIDIQVKCRKLEDTRNNEALYFLLQTRPFHKH